MGKKLYAQYTLLHGEKIIWDKYDPIPDNGQICIGYDLENGVRKNVALKAGDGKTPWSQLDWISGSSQDIIDRIENIEEEIIYIGYSVSIQTSGGTVLSNQIPTTTLTASLLKGSETVIDPSLTADKFEWTIDGDNTFSQSGESLVVNASDFKGAKTYRCTITFSNNIKSVGFVNITSLEGSISIAGYLDLINGNKMQYLNSDGGYIPSYSELNPLIVEPFLYESSSVENVIESSTVSWSYKTSGEFQSITQSTPGFLLDQKKLKITQNLLTAQTRMMTIKCEAVYTKDNAPYRTELFIDLFLTVQDSEQTSVSYNVILSNENHTIACDSNGNPKTGEIGSTGRATTTVDVFLGLNSLTPVSSLAELGESKYYLEVSSVPKDVQFVKKSNLKEFYLDGSGLNVLDSGTVTISIYIESEKTVVLKAFSFIKARDSLNGNPAKLLKIVGPQIFSYDGSRNVSPSNITLSSVKQNVSEVPKWFVKTSNGEWTDLSIKVDSLVVAPDKIGNTNILSYWIDNVLSLKAKISDDCFDEFSLYKIYDGTNSFFLNLDATKGTVFKNDSETSLPVKATLYSGNTDISAESSFLFEVSTDGTSWVEKTPSVADNTIIDINKDEVNGIIKVRCTCTCNGETYISALTISDLSDPYQVFISSSSGNIFKNNIGETTLTVSVVRAGAVCSVGDFSYVWKKIDKNGTATTIENATNKLSIAASDIDEKSTYNINVLHGETQIGFVEETIVDISDTISSNTQPQNPIEGMLWLDTSKTPPLLFVYRNGKWEPTSNSSVSDLEKRFETFEYQYERDKTGITERLTKTETSLIGVEESITNIENQKMYTVTIESSNGTVFKNGSVNTILSCKVSSWDEDVTATFPEAAFVWKRSSSDIEGDKTWNTAHSSGTKTLSISKSDVSSKAVFYCNVDLELCTGYKQSVFTGLDISAEDTYNDYVDNLTVKADTEQIGTPSPENPAPIIGSSGKVWSENLDKSKQTNIDIPPMYCLYDSNGNVIARDVMYVDHKARRRWIQRNCILKVFDGSTDESWTEASVGKQGYAYNGITIPSGVVRGIMCDKFKTITWVQGDSGSDGVCGINSRIRVYNHECLNVDTFKTSLQSNPITVLYQLAAPTTEELPYQNLTTYPYYTHIYTDCKVKPDMEIKLKQIERV